MSEKTHQLQKRAVRNYLWVHGVLKYCRCFGQLCAMPTSCNIQVVCVLKIPGHNQSLDLHVTQKSFYETPFSLVMYNHVIVTHMHIVHSNLHTV